MDTNKALIVGFNGGESGDGCGDDHETGDDDVDPVMMFWWWTLTAQRSGSVVRLNEPLASFSFHTMSVHF